MGRAAVKAARGEDGNERERGITTCRYSARVQYAAAAAAPSATVTGCSQKNLLSPTASSTMVRGADGRGK